ncbi:HIT family protein [Rhizobium sp. BK313]|uniref:HIT family protein n=1 Tax=Rhizobium sp. BK313 TaxID=2587081 RepID=UPI00105FEB21|nr:HIT family protein [Rhizobium sp. BK313]
MPDHACIFCRISDLIIIAENELAFAIRDKFPVRRLHTLIIPKRHVADIFSTDKAEREAIHRLAVECREAIGNEDPTVAGFNFGSNIGAAAGQKIFHAHVHLIPRRPHEEELKAARPD